MDRERASFAVRARRLRPLNGPGFSSEKVQAPSFPLVNRVTAQDWRSTTSFRCPSRRRSEPDGQWAKADRSWRATSSLTNHAEFKRGKSDRRLCFWLDWFRRLHLRQTNESLEADVPRHRLDGLSLLHQQRPGHDCDRRHRNSWFVL